MSRRIVNFLCGIESSSSSGGQSGSFDVNPETAPPQLSPQEEAVKSAEFLDEPPFWKK